jgi:HTH-type transcriptional regulator / antitoxin HigA
MKDAGESEMTIATLERRLKPLVSPVENELLRWLYLHLPPRPIKSRKMHRGYSEAVRILMRESGSLDADNRAAVGQYLNAVIPFVEQFEKREFPIGSATPEEVLGFLMEQHDLSQYDLAKELGGQPVVSQVLRGKRRLTREHIERLSKRFGVTPATFYPGGNLG